MLFSSLAPIILRNGDLAFRPIEYFALLIKYEAASLSSTCAECGMVHFLFFIKQILRFYKRKTTAVQLKEKDATLTGIFSNFYRGSQHAAALRA